MATKTKRKRSRPTPPARRKPAGPRGGRGGAAGGVVRVRMYNTGFGDCFLLRLPGPEREMTVLIDCGKHTLSRCAPPLKDVVRQVQADLREAGGGKPRVDVLVATHRHLDHVSGFALDGWADVEVGEVWMPWTEDPDDAEARRICERQSARALQLESIVPRLKLDAARAEQLLAYAGNNLSNADAMRLLHEGFRGRPRRRFLPGPGDAMGVLRSDALPGVEVRVLGPSRSERVIRDMDPPHGEAFLRAADGASPDPKGRATPPFSGKWRMDRARYEAWFRDRGVVDPLGDFTPNAAAHFRRVVENPEMELAAALEKSINGTSLVLTFKVGRAVLLFPGDAQWGTWSEMLAHEGVARLLKTVSFYKVGHHGSHNATPRRFVDDLLPATACAMVPTDTIRQWPLIPKHGLLTALREKGIAFVRGDVTDPKDDPRFRRHTVDGHTLYIDVELPTTG